MNIKEVLAGKTTDHLTEISISNRLLKVNHDVATPLLDLIDESKKAGFELAVISSFRSFEQQLVIWNEKASGVRPLLDSKENNLNIDELTDEELLFAILKWSAIPGASRHHWGTDIDVYDKSALQKSNSNYKIQLTAEETYGDGIFSPFHRWLDEVLESSKGQDFFRPYEVDRGGVGSERWHLSFKPVSGEYQAQYTSQLFSEIINESHLLLKNEILQNRDQIFQEYIDI